MSQSIRTHRSRRTLQDFRALPSGIAVTILTFALVVFLADVLVPQNHNSQLLNIAPLQGSTPVIANWECGCPPLEQRPTAETVHDLLPYGFPTRCLKENHPSNYRSFDWPYNSRKTINPIPGEIYPRREYPRIDIPPGYPASLTPRIARLRAGAPIPFPGWPACRFPRDDRDRWNGGLLRAYRDRYMDAPNAVNPSIARPDCARNVPTNPQAAARFNANLNYPWGMFQIHHVLERVHGGESQDHNLIPVCSYPNSWNQPYRRTNQHNEYTQWWNAVMTDHEFVQRIQAWVIGNPPRGFPPFNGDDPKHRKYGILVIALVDRCPEIGKCP